MRDYFQALLVLIKSPLSKPQTILIRLPTKFNIMKSKFKAEQQLRWVAISLLQVCISQNSNMWLSRDSTRMDFGDCTRRCRRAAKPQGQKCCWSAFRHLQTFFLSQLQRNDKSDSKVIIQLLVSYHSHNVSLKRVYKRGVIITPAVQLLRHIFRSLCKKKKKKTWETHLVLARTEQWRTRTEHGSHDDITICHKIPSKQG